MPFSPAPAPRLPQHPLVLTRSLEEACAFQSSINSPVEGELVERGARFEWRANRVVVGDLSIVASGYEAAVRGRTRNVDAQYSMIVPLYGTGRSTQGGREALVSPGMCAALVSPDMPASFELGAGYRGVQVSIPARMLESRLAAITEAPERRRVGFELVVDVSRGGGADVLRLLELLLAEAERAPNALMSPVVSGRLIDAFVAALLFRLPHDRAELLRASRKRAEPAYVRRAEAYLDANVDRHVSIAELAAAVGISARSLFAAFRAHRGYSPQEHATARRMERAKVRLASGQAISVSEAAISCGFSHLGRFSVAYRARFGERPSDTLRRARGR